jgi:hypothetical protein
MEAYRNDGTPVSVEGSIERGDLVVNQKSGTRCGGEFPGSLVDQSRGKVSNQLQKNLPPDQPKA